MKACLLFGAHNFFVMHEGLPNQLGAQVLSDQDPNPLVDPENYRCQNSWGRMEGIHKTVAAPGLFAPFRAHRAQNRVTQPFLISLDNLSQTSPQSRTEVAT
jgi:hypothetical protein